MTVYLGDHGSIQIKRKAGDPVIGTVDPADVSVTKRRFGLADNDVQGELITGDQVDIERVDGGNLELIAGHDYPDWRGYVFIDQMGGIRLYDRFDKSLAGTIDQALELVTPSTAQQLRILTRGSRYNYLAKVTEYEFTTERDTVNITQLGNQFKQQYEAGLISGQGRINCFFEYKTGLCDENNCGAGVEYSMYLSQLCIRLVQGADFLGRYYIYAPSTDSGISSTENEQSVWYDADCIVTNSTITVNSDQLIEANIQFVTTGQIKLSVGTPPSQLLQEDSSKILQEDGESVILLAGQDV